jgi:nitroreductase / dihydropteridine reductase
MEFQEIIAQRYATKLFDGRAVPEETVTELLGLVRWAPSGLNIQPWKVRIVSDAATKTLLSAASFSEPQIESCSHLLVFCADTDFAGLSVKLGTAMEQQGVPQKVREIVMGIAQHMGGMPAGDLKTWTSCQVYIAATYAILGAKALGLDSCPMTHFVPTEYSRILGLPDNIIPTLLCPIGYAADQPAPKWRYPVEDFII